MSKSKPIPLYSISLEGGPEHSLLISDYVVIPSLTTKWFPGQLIDDLISEIGKYELVNPNNYLQGRSELRRLDRQYKFKKVAETLKTHIASGTDEDWTLIVYDRKCELYRITIQAVGGRLDYVKITGI